MRVREAGRQLDGRVEIDDAYLGGERSGGKVGRGSENKIPIIAAVQTTADGQPIVACLRQQPHTAEEIDVFAARHLKGRRVAVVCDSDWAENAAVADQTNQDVEALESRGARAVRCAPPPKPDGSKRGIDDWLGEHPQEDRREKFLEIICPGNPVLTVDDPRLAVIRRSDGRKTIVDLVTEMGRQSDGQGLAAVSYTH